MFKFTTINFISNTLWNDKCSGIHSDKEIILYSRFYVTNHSTIVYNSSDFVEDKEKSEKIEISFKPSISRPSTLILFCREFCRKRKMHC